MTVTIYPARAVVTVDPNDTTASAVAVRNNRIVGVGSVEDLQAELAAGAETNDETIEINKTFAEHVVLPGLIDQHLHPFLGSMTLSTAVISIEDWILPEQTFPAASSAAQYLTRLSQAEAAMDDSDGWLFSWGYHSLWHGPLSREILDSVSTTRPIGIWQRSCHEFYLNSAALDRLGITVESMATSEHSAQLDVAAGHFWENGFFAALLPVLAPAFMRPDRIEAGLVQLVAYLHQNGVTAFNEPGAIFFPGMWEMYDRILGNGDTPLSSTFLVDARQQVSSGLTTEEALADAQSQINHRPQGKVRFLPGQVKLFADGAIISQMMQMRDGYVDRDGQPDPDHHGEWIMTPEVLEEQSKLYWDAGYQLHIHVNGDLGLDAVLDMLERRLAETPRDDHRTVIVHFANSTEDQVDRIAELGAIVSANPYYPVGFADKYSEVGLGPERADVMVRSQSVLQRSIPLSFHSDLPMGPSDPLAMVGFAVNRFTQSGRVAAPEQRISVEDGLRAVTIEAARSWRREHELGSIEVGKLASFTIVADDPRKIEPADIGRIAVMGSMFEGRWFPTSAATRARRVGLTSVVGGELPEAGIGNGFRCSDAGHPARPHLGCACSVSARLLRVAHHAGLVA